MVNFLAFKFLIDPSVVYRKLCLTYKILKVLLCIKELCTPEISYCLHHHRCSSMLSNALIEFEIKLNSITNGNCNI